MISIPVSIVLIDNMVEIPFPDGYRKCECNEIVNDNKSIWHIVRGTTEPGIESVTRVISLIANLTTLIKCEFGH